MKNIYLAGGLFNAGERLHNLFLERSLRKLGYYVILPQRRALLFFNDSKADFRGMIEDCQIQTSDPSNIYVGSTDGADADSGTAIEYGIAITKRGRAVIYRTDFRTEMTKELGVNGMFTLDGTEFIYEPCYFTDLDEVEKYYDKLARKIDEAIKKLTQ